MNVQIFVVLVVIGMITGVMGGLLGIGGALILIPSLVFFLGLNQQEAIGTSLAVLLPPIGIFAAYNYYKAGYVKINYAMVLAVTFMIGSYLSSKFAIGIPESIIRKIFSVLLIVISLKIFFSK
ncbi:MAG: sulfite exporter TauE/SafE family protein [Leptospiraceae bacterium]|nr:sulfite exporter TauE/SafE family protein [Leptospiraceae bacterium]MCK6382452.1 sulfite exporter TauE/SafE family protein [Leptospiraceae bacterium]